MTIHSRFDPQAVWDAIAGGKLTLFMAVPTIYSRLIAAWETAAIDRQAAISAGCRRLRLMVSGSAALPVNVLERWRMISGHVLLGHPGSPRSEWLSPTRCMASTGPGLWASPCLAWRSA